MPTYKNLTQNNIDLVLTDPSDIKRIVPGQQIEVYEIYTVAELAAYGLTEVYETPYYNPLLAVQDVVSDSDLISEVLINSLTKIVRIKEIDVDINVYFNSMSNLPGYPILANSSIDVKNRRNMIKIYIEFSSSGSCKILELKD